ncbi:(Fe-S)-binding protein, partial [Calditerricola satsumensis]|uniref:(Fe-S)-binding protein n=1 Tax=Calditerricola satsumensis TaxID=373054 RepID=UPI000ADC6936
AAAAYDVQLIGDVITEQEIWACTTCRNCEDQCPVMNEHVDKIIDLRRYLVLTQGEMPAEAARVFQNIERQYNPWGLSKNDRAKWRDGAEVPIPTVHEVEDFEYLLWVGSMGSYDNRSMKVVRALAKVLHEAGVSFAILGNEEKNSGDTPRRLGNEFLFQQLVQENIETFRQHNVRKIVTIDPHAYHTFKNEYPDFGFAAEEVVHHTELVARLLKEGRIRPRKEVRERVVYHDSCYLGRYNGVYDAPREILRAIPGVELVEMERNRENAMCCGAGGGLMWLEEREGTRVNVARTEQALATNPTVIGSACPYCLTMMSDGTKAKGVEDQVKTRDVVELLAEAL